MIRLVTVLKKDRELLWNINQKYLHEMTNYYDDPMDEKGNYHYGHFDEYFSDPKRVAYLLCDENVVNALLEKHPGQWEIKYNEKNLAAKHLWNKVAASYSPEVFHLNDEETVLLFTKESD